VEEFVDIETVVLVEGTSDQVALETLVARRGRDAYSEGIRIVAMGGATSINTFLRQYGPGGMNVGLAGLYDAGEERAVRRGLERFGFGSNLTRFAMEELGFFMCEADLEDELIRALGVTAVEEILAAQGDLRSFRILQQQPAQRGRPHTEQLRRFMGTRSGRKRLYAGLLADALDLDRVPRPLEGLLDHLLL
jgi:Overcoming lysogenization defect protein-like, TOPRIM domain